MRYISGEKILNNDQNLKNENSKPVLMASNKKLSEFIEIVKPHIKQLIEDINAVSIIFKNNLSLLSLTINLFVVEIMDINFNSQKQL